MGFSENKMFVSRVGIDSEYFENIEKAAPACDGVFLGRLSPSKGIFDLIEIWKKVAETLPKAKLVILGGGNQETKNILVRKIGDYKLEKNIELLGFLEDEKAYSILKSGKVFLSPSHEEGWGIAVAEAMACGLPVVSWDLPVYKNIFGNYAIQIEENNFDEFSSAVVKLLEDETLRFKTGSANKEFIKKYSWDAVAKKEMEAICSA
jgi:glycosyltransferase involved in cell wall biosynthesis